jgi:hypothetical protein
MSRFDRKFLHSLPRKTFVLSCLFAATALLTSGVPAAAQTALSDDTVKAAGRDAAALVARKDSAALFARFTPELARTVPQEQLRATLLQLISDQSPLGKPITETVREQGGGVRAYVGEYQWRADRNLYLTFAFAPGTKDKIAGMRLRPAVEREAAVRKIGRDFVALIAAKDAKKLFSRFTPELAAKIAEPTLLEVLDKTLTQKTPLGALVRDSIELADGDYFRYSAVHVWNKAARQNIDVAVIFEAGGANRIAGLTLRPALPAKLPPDPKAGYKQKARLMLPFAPGDEWYVFWGGDTRAVNYHVDFPDQRHALDLVVRRDGSTHSGDGKENAEYYAWGKVIVAPGAGTVVAVVNDLPDNKPGVTTDTRNPAGNYVVLDLGGSEYAALAHLQKGSVRVKAGDTVKAGDVLGLCGNSGNSTEPHLHFHLQDRPKLFGGALGLPVVFSDYTVSGKKVTNGSPVQGQSLKRP